MPDHIGVDLSKDGLDICDPAAAKRASPTSLGSSPAGSPASPTRIVYEATSGCDGLRRRSTRPGGPARGSIRCTPGTSPVGSTGPRPTGSTQKPGAIRGRAPAGPGRAARPDPRGSSATSSSAATSSTHASAGEEPPRPLPGTPSSGRRPRRARHPRRPPGADRGRRSPSMSARHPELAAADRLFRSIPGIGPVSAMALLAISASSAASTAAPSLRSPASRPHPQSGERGRRCLGDGRRQVRRVLYIGCHQHHASSRLPRGLHRQDEGRGRPRKGHRDGRRPRSSSPSPMPSSVPENPSETR